MFKKSILATSLIGALALASGNANAVLMDLAGGSGAGLTVFNTSAVKDVNSLEWKPDNALALNALGSPTGAMLDQLGIPRVAGQGDNDQYFQTVAQGVLGTFGLNGVNGAFDTLPAAYGREFTFQTSFWEFSQGLGSASTSAFRLAPGDNYFRIYADTTPDANQITGTGYGAGSGSVLILEGTLSEILGNYTDFTRLDPTNPQYKETIDLDKFTGDGSGNNAPGVTTHQGSGSNKITVDINYLNPAYFLGDLTQLVLTLTYVDTTNLADPFISANPSDTVVGETPSYSVVGGAPVNGGNCSFGDRGPIGMTETGGTGNRCDFHFQTDASGAFVTTTVPEPGSIALAALALGALAVTRRRKV